MKYQGGGKVKHSTRPTLTSAEEGEATSVVVRQHEESVGTIQIIVVRFRILRLIQRCDTYTAKGRIPPSP